MYRVLKILCGGSLIGCNVVMTAAHCIAPFQEYVLKRVKLGHAKISKMNIEKDIEIIKIHPEYKNDRHKPNDIAILKLSGNVEFDAAVKPICLPSGILDVLWGLLKWLLLQNCLKINRTTLFSSK